jgi:hypothetical protein
MNLEARLRKPEIETATAPTHEDWVSYLVAISDRDNPINRTTIAAFEAMNHDASPARMAELEAMR